jgi:hypothetical protein
MGFHVAQGRPRNPPMKLGINMANRHPNAYSWMEDYHKSLERKGGQLPRTSLIEALIINCRRVTLGTGGGKW